MSETNIQLILLTGSLVSIYLENALFLANY